MSHALIIEDNMIVSRAIEQQLAEAGFDSCDHAWTEQRALDLARKRFPDLIVVSDDLDRGAGLGAARKISQDRDVAILLATTDSLHARRHLADDASLQGPYRLDQIGSAVNAALQSTSRDAAPLLEPCCLAKSDVFRHS